jgi:hypothetical protein
LDNSVSYANGSVNRIGISENQREGVYHGHVRPWSDLTQKMHTALTQNGFTKINGKTI